MVSGGAYVMVWFFYGPGQRLSGSEVEIQVEILSQYMRALGLGIADELVLCPQHSARIFL